MDANSVRKESSTVPNGDNNKKSKKTVKWGVIGLATLAAVSLGVAGYFYVQYQDVKNDPNAALEDRNADETSRVLTKLKSVLQVDEADSPTVARVDDPGKLKNANEQFYANVQQGDYLILYPQRVIIFRESNNQIVNVAPIINTSELTTTDQQPAKDEADQE